MKMSLKTAKRWCFRLFAVVLFLVSYYCSHVFLQSYGGTSKSPLTPSKSLCGGWLKQKKWESLNFKVTAAESVSHYCQLQNAGQH
ncbi:unnamed protein product [Oncorhynchus mykiss]|uniref:Uncharacterized protein n=1 Tax=Oncorhynchus mykiss TaxID=8022 RepID=A0A060XJJ3_ONCMY|nr:unnamed protein product [Oncorhynchus mykiss]